MKLYSKQRVEIRVEKWFLKKKGCLRIGKDKTLLYGYIDNETDKAIHFNIDSTLWIFGSMLRKDLWIPKSLIKYRKPIPTKDYKGADV
jgi:hypothetical protein